MAIFRLDVEKRFGQLRFRLYQQGSQPGDFGGEAADMAGLLANLDEALAPLDTKSRTDSVIFRNIEYATKRDLKETVRLSKF